MGTVLGLADKILLLIFIVFAMMSITLEATLRDVARVLHNKSLVVRALGINFVMVPLFAIFVVKLMPMALDVKDGILLLAVLPGDLMSFNFTRKLCARIELAAAVLFLLTLATVLLGPVLANWILESQLPVKVPYGPLIKGLFFYVVLPLLAGIALNKFFPRLASALLKPFSIISGLAFIAFTIVTGSIKTSAAKAIAGGGTLAGLALFIVGAMMIGWFLAGSDRERRGVLSVSSGLRSLAIALAIAKSSFPDGNADLAILASGALGFPIAFLFTTYQQRKSKKLHRMMDRPTVGAA